MLDRLEKDFSRKVLILHKELAPLEKELEKVRLAKKAIDAAKNQSFAEFLGSRLPDFAGDNQLSQYQSYSMKELAIEALEEHFKNGATSNNLLNYFKTHWGRGDIERSSFSPQLSRLKHEGKIKLEGKVWHLITSDKNEAPTEDQSEGASETDEVNASSNHGEEINDLLP